MTFEALSSLRAPILIHIIAACLSLVIGPFALFRRSRDIWHRVFGYAWVLAMLVTALSSFWINGLRLLGPFSPIHLLSLFVLWSLAEGIWQARRGQIAKHRAGMQALYVYAMCITGLFTLLPGRLMNELVLGGARGWPLMAGLVSVGVLIIYIHRQGVLPLGKPRGLH